MLTMKSPPAQNHICKELMLFILKKVYNLRVRKDLWLHHKHFSRNAGKVQEAKSPRECKMGRTDTL